MRNTAGRRSPLLLVALAAIAVAIVALIASSSGGDPQSLWALRAPDGHLHVVLINYRTVPGS